MHSLKDKCLRSTKKPIKRIKEDVLFPIIFVPMNSRVDIMQVKTWGQILNIEMHWMSRGNSDHKKRQIFIFRIDERGDKTENC